MHFTVAYLRPGKESKSRAPTTAFWLFAYFYIGYGKVALHLVPYLRPGEESKNILAVVGAPIFDSSSGLK